MITLKECGGDGAGGLKRFDRLVAIAKTLGITQFGEGDAALSFADVRKGVLQIQTKGRVQVATRSVCRIIKADDASLIDGLNKEVDRLKVSLVFQFKAKSDEMNKQKEDE